MNLGPTPLRAGSPRDDRARPSNTDIATTLFLSHATIKTHISRIFAKLDVRDRAQGVIAGYDAGLVRAAPHS
jgi:Bacterial regulatory proteins, luxR family